jgi:Fur family transcriptional regulator, ferric uptake regulator
MIASTQTNHPLTGAPQGTNQQALDFATAKLKSAGLRITQPRLAILAALGNRLQPTSIEQIHELVGADACDLVTIYRCMAAFEEIGLVRRAFFHNGTSLYEINLGKPMHYHVVCKATNNVEELDAETSAELHTALVKIEEKLQARGYSGVGHIVEFFGVAPQAQPGAGSQPERQSTGMPAVN